MHSWKIKKRKKKERGTGGGSFSVERRREGAEAESLGGRKGIHLVEMFSETKKNTTKHVAKNCFGVFVKTQMGTN